MNLNVKIQDHSFKLNIGSGHNDWTWLSHYAARKFSKISYPQGTYLPAQLFLVDKENQQIHPHPRQKIRVYLQDNKLSPQNLTAVIKIRKGNHAFTPYEKLWQGQAYGLERMMMNVTYVLDTEKYRNKEGEKDFFFVFCFHYKMHNDIKHFFNQKKYASPIEIQLQQSRYTSQTSKSTTFKGQIKLPFGQVIHPQLIYHYKDPKDPSAYRSQKIKDIELKPQLFKVNLMITPKYISIQQQNTLAAQEMRISQNITKNLQQKQLQTNKRNISLSMCCYGFEQFWKLLENGHGYQLKLEGYDNSTRERLKIILEKSLNDLYKIFFYYFTIENQTREKKEDLAVAYQNVMHFLRFYQIFKSFKKLDKSEKNKMEDREIQTSRQQELRLLQQFLDLYNNLRPTTLKDTVNVQQKGIKFVQFVSILLRAISFKQTQLSTNKGQTFDVSVASVIDHIISIQSQQDLFSPFKQNIRKNPNMIQFLRLSSDNLKQIFIYQISKSTQKSQQKYIFTKEQFKMMLENSGLTGDNTDRVIQSLFSELELPEEGLYYYEFVEAMQWLAMALVESSKDDAVFSSEDQETSLVIQKIKYLIEKVMKKMD